MRQLTRSAELFGSTGFTQNRATGPRFWTGWSAIGPSLAANSWCQTYFARARPGKLKIGTANASEKPGYELYYELY